MKQINILVRQMKANILQIKPTLSKSKLPAAIRFRNSMSLSCPIESTNRAKIYNFWSWNILFRIQLVKVSCESITSGLILITLIKMALRFLIASSLIRPSANEEKEVTTMTELFYMLNPNVR